MFIATMKLLLLLSMILENNPFVCAEGPTIRIANGSIAIYSVEVYVKQEPLELFCTGRARDLKMTKYEAKEEVTTTIVNKTTIRLFEERPKLGHHSYYCKNIKSHETASISVRVLAVPKTTDFRCISQNLNFFNCTWTSPKEVGDCKFLLYYVKDGHSSILCENIDTYYNKPRVCLWVVNNYLMRYDKKAITLTFMMETCNKIGCTNQTFVIDHYAVVKLDAPKGLRVLNAGSHSAALQWDSLHFVNMLNSIPLHYKISYWYYGTQQFVVNTKVGYDKFFFLYYNEYNLELPCASMYYEVRVSVRLESVIEEELWSDDAIVSVVTSADPDNVDVVNPTCNQQEEIELSPKIMVYEIAKLKVKMRKEHNKTREMIGALKSKCKIDAPKPK